MDITIDIESMEFKLRYAQSIISEVYHSAKLPHPKYTGSVVNQEAADLLSAADSCISEALDCLERSFEYND